MKIVIYSSIMVKNPTTDKPIDLPSSFELIPGYDYVLITNLVNGKEIFKKSGWNKGEIRIMEPPEEEMPNKNRRAWQVYANRWFKWHPDKLFSDYDIVIYVDGFNIPNFNKKEEWNKIIGKFCNETQLLILQDNHPKNSCIYQEHDSIVKCGKDNYFSMIRVTKYVKTMGCPLDIGLYWNGCYIYKTGSKIIQKVWSDMWFDMLSYTYRDQALLMFEIWRNNAFQNWGKAPLNTLVLAVDSDSNHGGY